MENDNSFSPQQSLQLIESMINRAKDTFAEDGFMYLFWGWLVFGCSILQFILLHYIHYAEHYIVWLVVFPACLFQYFYVRKKHKQQNVQTYTHYIVAYVWITYVIVILLVSFFIGIVRGGDYFLYIISLLLAIYGMPIFLTGIIVRFKPLIYGGIACWILCVISTFIENYDYQFLLIPVAMLVAWIIPGYLLRVKYKQQ